MAKLNESVMILETEDNCVADHEMIFPVQDVDQGLIRYRTYMMAELGHWFKFTVDQEEAYLELWEVQRTQWSLVRDVGVLKKVALFVEGLKLDLNVVVVHNNINIQDLPMHVPTGAGMAFLVSEKAFAVFRDNYKEELKEWEIDVGKRLLFHTIVDRRCFPDLGILDFVNWPYFRVQQLIDSWEGQAPGHLWARVSARECGLLSEEDKMKEVGLETERLLGDINDILHVTHDPSDDPSDPFEDKEEKAEETVPVIKARLIVSEEDGEKTDEEEKEAGDRRFNYNYRDDSNDDEVKEKNGKAEDALGSFRFKPLNIVWQEGSPTLSSPRRSRDADEGRNGAKRKRRTNKHMKKRDRMERNERAWRKRQNQGLPSSPVTISEDQEKWLIKLLVKCVEPSATEDTLKYNMEHKFDDNGDLVPRFSRSYMDDATGELSDVRGAGGFGTGPGGWVLSRSDRKDIENLKKNVQEESPGQNASLTMTSSSVVSPRGETSLMGIPSSGERSLGEGKDSTMGSGPNGKRVRVSVSSDVFDSGSPGRSPFLVKVGDTPRVVTVSSSSSSGDERVIKRLSLGEMFSGMYFTFPENGIINSPRIDITTEEECEDGTMKGDEGGK